MTRRTMIAAPLLHTIESAGEAVLTLSETLEEAEFRRSRLVRPEVQERLRRIWTEPDSLNSASTAPQQRSCIKTH